MKKIIATKNAPQAIGPYSQGVVVGNMLFISGQIGFDPATGTVVEGGVGAQTKRVLDNIKGVVEEAGATMDHIAKVSIFFKDLSHFQEVNEIYATYFTENPPARAAVEVSRLPRDVLIEMEAIAYLGDGTTNK